MEEADKQVPKQLAPFMWKKGQSGNLNGRPPGKTMKEYARDYLARMTDEERDAFFEGQSKTDIWKMAEGNPATKTDLTSGGKPLQVAGFNFITNGGTNPDNQANA